MSTVKKSHAMMLCACPRMNSRHEHPPALTARPDPGADHDLADARRGDLDRETKQLAGNPPGPPPRVLASEPQDQLANLQADPGTTGTPP